MQVLLRYLLDCGINPTRRRSSVGKYSCPQGLRSATGRCIVRILSWIQHCLKSSQDAIQKGPQANLSVLVAGTRVDEAEGALQRGKSAALLPRVNAETYANFQNRNLRAFGISVPGIPFPKVVGPFSNYDFRIYAQQNIVELASHPTMKAG